MLATHCCIVIRGASRQRARNTSPIASVVHVGVAPDVPQSVAWGSRSMASAESCHTSDSMQTAEEEEEETAAPLDKMHAALVAKPSSEAATAGAREPPVCASALGPGDALGQLRELRHPCGWRPHPQPGARAAPMRMHAGLRRPRAGGPPQDHVARAAQPGTQRDLSPVDGRPPSGALGPRTCADAMAHADSIGCSLSRPHRGS